MLPTLAAAVIFILLLKLGFWQLQRADYKEDLYQSYQEKLALGPVSFDEAAGVAQGEEALAWRKIVMTGEYAGSGLYLLDNRVENGKAGYHVYSPFLPRGADRWVMVNRGWIAAGNYRDVLPDIDTPAGTVTLTGRISPVQQSPGRDDYAEDFGNGIKRIQELKLGKIGGELGYNFIPFVVRLQSPSPSAYSLNWVEPGSGKAMHLGYAFQWFLLAFTLLIIYFSVFLKRILHDDE